MRIGFYEAVAGILLVLALIVMALDLPFSFLDSEVLAQAGIGFAVLDRAMR